MNELLYNNTIAFIIRLHYYCITNSMQLQLEDDIVLGARPAAPRVQVPARTADSSASASDDSESAEPGLTLKPRVPPPAAAKGLGHPNQSPTIDNALTTKSFDLYGPVRAVRNDPPRVISVAGRSLSLSLSLFRILSLFLSLSRALCLFLFLSPLSHAA